MACRAGTRHWSSDRRVALTQCGMEASSGFPPAAGAAAMKEEPAEEEGFQMTEAEYKMMLLEHWRERVTGGRKGMPEHDIGVSAKVRALHRKKRKLAGIFHPMFDTAPPTFLQQYQLDPTAFDGVETAERGHGDGEEDEEGAANESARPQAAVGSKKSRSGKPVAKKEIIASSPAHLPFGNGPFAAERRLAWAAAMKQVGPKHRDMFKVLQNQQMDAKKCVQMCQKRYRKDALASLKLQRDFMARARKVSKDAGTIWRRENAQALAAAGKLDSNAVASADVSKSRKEAREAMERKRMEEAERERVRQQKRINFLLTQTELFAHFIGQKMGGITDDNNASRDAEPTPAPEAGEQTPALASKEEERLMAAKKKGQLDKGETREALASAQAALQNRQRAMQSFDEETREATKKLSKKDDTALVNSLDSAALQHTDVNLTAEAASIFNGTLKAYQKIGFNWLVSLYEQGLNGILADEMGLGKTVQTISLLSYLSENKGIWGPFLVVAPTSTMHNWYSEFQKFCPQMKVIPYFGANPNERKLLRRMWTNPADLGTPEAAFHVLVTNYKLVIADEKHFARVKWQYMVLDEAQAVKNSASQRWKTLLGFNCRNRLLLTGTPIQNSMAELWALLHFIMPELFDSFSDFTEWFSKDIESSAEGKGSGLDSAQLKRLQLILQPFMLRRTKKDVLDELVQKVEVEMRTPLSNRQKYYYEVLKKRVTSTAELLDRNMLSKDDKRLHSLMNLVMQFRKVCNHPEIFERRDFQSPLQMRDYVLPALPPPPTEAVVVNVINHNPIQLSIPALVFDDVAAHTSWSRLNASARTRILTTLLSPWSVDALHRSLFPLHPAPKPRSDSLAEEYSGTRRKGAAFAAAVAAAAAARMHAHRVQQQSGGMSCLRLAGLSEGEVSFLAWASPAERWLASLALSSQELARRSACWNDDAGRNPKSGGEGGNSGDAAADIEDSLRGLAMPGRRRGRVADIVLPWRTTDMEREWEGQLVVSTSRRLHEMAQTLRAARAYAPPAQASPVQLACSRREFGRRQEVAMGDLWARRLLLGGFEAGECPLVWGNELSCVSSVPFSLQRCNVAPCPAWPSMMTGFYSRLGSNCIRKPDMSKLVSDSGKLRVLDTLLPQLKAGGHKVLMFCQMTKMMDILEDYFWYRKHMYLRLDGSASIADRRDMVNDFQSEDSEYFLFLLSTRAGGLGINLTAADTVIFYDSDWNPTMDAQAMDRAHRLGQTKQVTVYRLVSRNTIEERILHRAKQKDSIQKMVISGDKASAAFKGGGSGDSFKATDFADLLFEDDEEEEKGKTAPHVAKEPSQKAGKDSAKNAKSAVKVESAGAKTLKGEGKGEGHASATAAPAASAGDATIKKEEEERVGGNSAKMQVDEDKTSAGTGAEEGGDAGAGRDESSGIGREQGQGSGEKAAGTVNANGAHVAVARAAGADVAGVVGAGAAVAEEGEVTELCEWLKVGGKVEVEWGSEWWEGMVRKILVTSKGKAGKVEVEYVGGEDEAEWIEISHTKVLGWVSARMRELEPEPEVEVASNAESGKERLKIARGGVSIGSDGLIDDGVVETTAERKAREQALTQARLESSRSAPAIIMDMDD